jgi:hypothetical protein
MDGGFCAFWSGWVTKYDGVLAGYSVDIDADIILSLDVSVQVPGAYVQFNYSLSKRNDLTQLQFLVNGVETVAMRQNTEESDSEQYGLDVGE